jgi:RimJ/RimL family protein N-acetyltransferase
LEYELLTRPGTSIRPNEERRGARIVVWYQAGEQSLIWCDPELSDRFADLAHDERFTDQATVSERVTSLGLGFVASANMYVLPTPPEAPAPIDPAYTQHWLQDDNPKHYELVKAFADRSDPDDVEEAALDELDGIETFNEEAINVLTVTGGDPEQLVAYASAVNWDWDTDFADIGVMVDAAHRRRGLGVQVVAHTVAKLQSLGRLPLYRHGLHNAGSQRIAELNGFDVATTLAFFAPSDD